MKSNYPDNSIHVQLTQEQLEQLKEDEQLIIEVENKIIVITPPDWMK